MSDFASMLEPVTVQPIAPPPAAIPEIPPAPEAKVVAPPKHRRATLPNIFTPNLNIAPLTRLELTFVWVAAAFALWYLIPSVIVPKPGEVLSGFLRVWSQGVAVQLIASLSISLQAVFWASLIGLGLAYASTIAAFKPVSKFVGNLRTAPLTGMLIFFVLYTPNGHWLKVAVLTFTIVVFLVNEMVTTIENIPLAAYEHARTIGYNEFQIAREVVVRGTLPHAFDSLSGNAAMAWMTLPVVEGFSRSEGGLGVVLLNLDRHMDHAAIVAVLALIVLVGMGQVMLIKFVKGLVCPYTKL